MARHYRVLGSLSVEHDGREIDLGGPRQRRLLSALLIDEGRVVSTDRLIDVVWDGDPPQGALRTLRTYVARLRRVLDGDHSGTDPIETAAPGYRFVVDGDHFDRKIAEKLITGARRDRGRDPVAALAALEEATRLWRGRPYDEFADEEWARAEVAHLEEVRLGALEDLVEAQLAAGSVAQSIEMLEPLVIEHPFRDRFRFQLMLALYRTGRQTEALRSYQKFRAYLGEEVGLEPSDALQTLDRRISESDVGLFLKTPAGRALRGYRLGEELGSGQYGVVYRGVQPELDREVAIKVIRPELANEPEFIRRFETEAQMIARIEHPYVVPLHDYWREPDAAYLVMRLMRGGSVADQNTREPWMLSRINLLVQQVGGALAAAHRAGLVHQDVRPSNILLDDDGNAYLSDFGLAQDVVSKSGELSGSSPMYAAPEVLTSEPIGAAADVHSLGAVVYELAAGRPPFEATSASSEIIARITRDDFPTLDTIRPDLPEEVRSVVARATARNPADRFADAGAFVRAFAQAVAAEDAAVVPNLVDNVPNPYRGLAAFTEADADVFFGRGLLVSEIVDRLHDERFLAVVGPSGSGKSSAVRAGLLPRLRRGSVPSSEDGFVIKMLPGRNPFDELEVALLRIAVNPPASLLDQLMTDDRGIARAIARVLPPDGQLLLVIDQFEELFTQTHETVRHLFLDGLTNAIEDERVPLRVVITIRADYYDRPLNEYRIGMLVKDGTVAVAGLSPGELTEAISAPAMAAGVRIAPEVVAEMVSDVTDRPSALPLLQYTLTELFERRQSATLTAESYQTLGGVAGSMARRADSTLAELESDDQMLARLMFRRLVTIGELDDHTRRRTGHAELVSLADDPARMNKVIDAFGEARLLAFDRDPVTRAPTVEVAHEALLTAWPTFSEWIEEGRDSIRLQGQLATEADEWVRNERSSQFLLRAGRLSLFEGWDRAGETTPIEGEFLDASLSARAGERARSRRVRRIVALALSGAAIVATIFGVAAIRERNEADMKRAEAQAESDQAAEATRLATARELAGVAAKNLAVDPELSILLALAAVEATGPDGIVAREAEEALHEALLTSRVVETLPSRGRGEFSPDGRFFAGGGGDGIGRVWETDHWQIVMELEGHEDRVYDIAWSYDGSRLVTASWDGTVGIWDSMTGIRTVSIPVVQDSGVFEAAFSLDDSSVAAAFVPLSADEAGVIPVFGDVEPGGVAMFDSQTGELIRNFAHGDVAVGLDFSPDGHTLAAAGGDWDDGVSLWDTRSGDGVLRIDPNDGSTLKVEFSPVGTLIAISSFDGPVKLFEASSGGEVRSLSGREGVVSWGLGFAPDGARLATASDGGTASIWDVESGIELMVLSGHAEGVYAATFSPDGSQVATDSDDGTVKIWDATAAGLGENLTVSVGFAWPANAAYDPSGTRFATPGLEGLAHIWSANDGSMLATFEGHDWTVTDIAWSPDGKSIATASSDGTVKQWNAATGSEIGVLHAHDTEARGVTFSEDGSHVLTIWADGSAAMIDLGSVTLPLVVPDLNDGWLHDGAISPDGSTFATAGQDGSVAIRNSTSGAEVATLCCHEFSAYSAEFNGDGSLLLTAGEDAVANVWLVSEAGANGPALVLDGHTAGVADATFNPDESHIATASYDGTVRLWDAADGAEVLRLATGIALSVEFSPDGTNLLVATGSGGVLILSLEVEELVEMAHRRLTRWWTPEECQRYLHTEACPPTP